MTGEATVAQVGDELLALIARTAAGALTKAEDLGHTEFHI